jgi:hypothetical protein
VKKITSLLKKLDAETDIPALRAEILDLILECMEKKKNSFGDWEKTHFSNAVGALALNIHSLQQPTVAWLRLCLIDLARAIEPTTEHDPNFSSPDPSMRDVTYDRLIGTVDSLGRELSRSGPLCPTS